ncbi:MAG: uncharacterized protein KVP18_004154 [Porospora cf. gigantea A]|uniref:uncharacterized protein n=1 Tax=Porospora cf. gigantea A TaxID=2853593 RepID=UPI00355A100F|nr:MAG: hypothetical protein KVP18_004154 [Porospora cf. gigantea A]
MFNGVGLPTPRGSGTSGYVKKNLSFVKTRRHDSEVKQQLINKKTPTPHRERRQNDEILKHEEKRKLEAQVAEKMEEWEDEGLDEEEVERKAVELRKQLTERKKPERRDTRERREPRERVHSERRR